MHEDLRALVPSPGYSVHFLLSKSFFFSYQVLFVGCWSYFAILSACWEEQTTTIEEICARVICRRMYGTGSVVCQSRLFYQKMNEEINNGTFWHRAMLVVSLVTILVILTAPCIRYPCCPSTYIEFLFGNQCNVPLFGADCMYLRHQSQIFCQGRAKLWGFPPFDLPSWSM